MYAQNKLRDFVNDNERHAQPHHKEPLLSIFHIQIDFQIYTCTSLPHLQSTEESNHAKCNTGYECCPKITMKRIKLFTCVCFRPWSKIIKERRLGHLLRLHPETPARKALKEYFRKVKRPQGRPKTTWMQTVRQNLASTGIKLDLSKEAQTLNRLSDLTWDRKNWRGIVRRVVQY